MKQQRYKGTKLSPEGREQPDFIFRYLDARALRLAARHR